MKLSKFKLSVKRIAIACLTVIGLASVYQVAEPVIAHAKGLENFNVGISGGNIKINSSEFENINQENAWNTILEKYRFVIVGISGIGTISMVLFFIMNFIKLGSVAHSPGDRAKIISALIYSGVAAMGLGSVTFIVGLFYGALR